MKKIELLENVKKYNTSNIDITKYVFSDDFTIGNYFRDDEIIKLMVLGVPCGAIQLMYKGKELSHREEHELSEEQLAKTKQVYVPINSMIELAEHHATHFCSYTINPKYIEPKKVQSFRYRFNLLTDKNMRMFDIKDINKHEMEILNNIPLTYEKLDKIKNKYITPELEKKFLETHKSRLTEERFYELLNGDACKGVGNIFLKEFDKKETEEEFE